MGLEAPDWSKGPVWEEEVGREGTSEEEKVVGRVAWTAAWRRSWPSRCCRWNMSDCLEGRVKRRFDGRGGSAEEDVEDEEEEEEEDAEKGNVVVVNGAAWCGSNCCCCCCCRCCCLDCCMMEAIDAKEGGGSME